MIEIRKLTKKYRDLTAVNDISFTVEKGEILGFLGPNGAGKTTTMRMITGFLSPTSGHVYVDGLDVFDSPLVVKKKIGYLPETPPVYMDMSVESYLHFAAELKGLPHREVKKEIARVADRCGITHNLHRLIRHLSKGYRQRVGLAQSLLGSPSVLILDEPTVGLDPAQMREVRSLIKELAQEHTVILSTHILPEVQMICNRASIIHRGQIVASDTIENLSQGMGKETRVRVDLVIPDTQAAAFLQQIPGIQHVEVRKADQQFDLFLDDLSLADGKLLKTLANSPLSVRECYNVTPTLEDIFLRAVSGRELEDSHTLDTAPPAEEFEDAEESEEDDMLDMSAEDSEPEPEPEPSTSAPSAQRQQNATPVEVSAPSSSTKPKEKATPPSHDKDKGGKKHRKR